MKEKKAHPGLWLPIVALLSILLSGCASKNVTEIAVTPGTAIVEPSVALPLLVPSLTDGKTHFNENCSSCHAQSSQVQISGDSPINLIPTDWLRQTSPTEMYIYLTTGAPKKGMPAFSSLSSGDRWDVVAYLLSLISSEGDRSRSGLIYQNMCQSCHGNSGGGDGTLAQAKELTISSWQNDPLLIEYSNEDLYYSIRSGNEHDMGTFAVMLNEAQIWSLVANIRSLSTKTVENTVVGGAASSQITSGSNGTVKDEGAFSLMGSVKNGSDGSLIRVSDIRLILEDENQNQQQMTGLTSQDGSFRFDNIPYHAAWNYFIEMDHDRIVYQSTRLYGQNFSANKMVPLSLTVYDSTSKITGLRAERLHILMDFQSNGMIHVTESYLIHNPSSTTIAPANAQTPLMNFSLSKEAQNITFENASKMQNLQIVNQSLNDWQPILPDSVHQVMFEYDVPFTGERTLEFISPVQVVSAMVMVESPNNDVKCSGMQSYNQKADSSALLTMFTDTNVPAGEKMVLRCINREQVFPVVIGIISILFLLLAVFLIVKDSRKKGNQGHLILSKNTKKTTLLDAIIALDDQLKAGEITQDVYRAKREELIKKLEGE